MLKKCYGLFLGLVVLAGSACVTPTHASSASIVITNIRASGLSGPTEEGVVLYNNSSFEVNVTDWCLVNKYGVTFACIPLHVAGNETQQVILPAYRYATIVASSTFINPSPDFYTAVYAPINQSSGSIVAGSDTISLIDADSVIVDQYSWSSSLTSSQQWERMKFSLLPDFYLDTNSASDWQKLPYTQFPDSQVEYRSIFENPQEPEDPADPTEPVDPGIPQPVLLPAIITELLPNPSGSDVGNEFIEMHNPNIEGDISLEGYKLSIGPALEKVIILGKYILKPGEYKVLSNAEYSYTLVNTSSKVSLTTPSGIIASEVSYSSPPDGKSWALVGSVWQYVAQPTPGSVNVTSSSGDETDADSEAKASSSTLEPCAENQYRSPETNRCRLVSSSATTTPTPCKVGQERNPATNRCRNIASSTSQPVPCKAGQERNPETNRCRNIKQLIKTDFGVKGATNKQQGGMGWYMWAAIGGIIMLIIGYAVWEWRDELKKLIQLIKAKFVGKAN